MSGVRAMNYYTNHLMQDPACVDKTMGQGVINHSLLTNDLPLDIEIADNDSLS